MSILDWVRDLVGFDGFQGSPCLAPEMRNTTRHEARYGIPCWTVPDGLLCIFVGKERFAYKYSRRLFGRGDLNRVACRLKLVIEMLDFAYSHGGGFGVKAMYREFSYDISLHDVMALARSLERVGILERPPQLNKPRRLNREIYVRWRTWAIDWLQSEPEYSIT